MKRLKALIGQEDDLDYIREYLIDLYRGYNLSLLEELTKKLPEELITQITKDN